MLGGSGCLLGIRVSPSRWRGNRTYRRFIMPHARPKFLQWRITGWRGTICILEFRPRTRRGVFAIGLGQLGRYFDDCITLLWQLRSNFTSRGALHDLFQVAHDCSLVDAIVHPLGPRAEAIARDGERFACQTTRADLITLLAAQFASPAALLASKWCAHCEAVRRQKEACTERHRPEFVYSGRPPQVNSRRGSRLTG